MKIDVKRERKLPAFRLTVPEAKALLVRIQKVFSDPETTSIKVVLNAGKEKFTLESLRDFDLLPPKTRDVTDFEFVVSDGQRLVRLASGGFSSNRGIVVAYADNSGWCAGAIETVHSFVLTSKTWYSSAIRFPFGFSTAILFATGLLLMNSTFPALEKFGDIGAILTVLAVPTLLLYLTSDSLFPGARIVLAEQPNLLARRSAEITAITGLLALLISILVAIFKT